MAKREKPAILMDIFVSAIVVTDKQSKYLSKEIKTLSSILQAKYANYEIIVVDGGVLPQEMQKVTKLLDTIPCVRIVRLSRHATKDVCVFVGLESAIGDIVVIKSFNDPPKLLTTFVAEATQYDLVFGVSKQRTRAGLVNHYGAKLFYWYNKKFLQISIPENATYYMALSRRAVNALTRSGRNARHIRYLARQIGYSSCEVQYDPKESMIEHNSIPRLITSALELSTTYSNRPLRFLAWLGFLGSFLNLVYALYVVTVRLFKHNVAEGWTTLSLQSSVMFFLLFAILAFICEYIGKILQETQADATYHIADELNSKVSVADATRRNITN